MRRVESIIVESKRSRGTPRRTWDEQTRVNLHELNFSEGLTMDRSSWRRHISMFRTTDVLFDYLLVFLVFASLVSFTISFCFVLFCSWFYLFIFYKHWIYLSRVVTPLSFSSGGTPLAALSFIGMSCLCPFLRKPCP